MPIVSIIIPIYNAEKYLRQCLDSVINQTLKEIEIICVDDGSQDGSLGILKEYAAKDDRFVILNQANAGAGAARNKGLRLAQGEFLSFLDADDFFEPTMLQAAYEKCLEYNADFVVFQANAYDNLQCKYDSSMWTGKSHLLPDKQVFSYRDIKQDIFMVFNGWAWDKLYKRAFVERNQLYFQEQRSTNDMYFVFAALVCAKRIAVCEEILAHHRINLDESLSMTHEKSWYCFYDALIKLRNRLYEMHIYEEVEESYINYALSFSLWHLKTMKDETFETLYYKLQDTYFDELGISSYPEAKFHYQSEFEQYKLIKEMPLVIYLLHEIDMHKDEIGFYKKILTMPSHRIGRAITFVPRMIRCFFAERCKL